MGKARSARVIYSSTMLADVSLRMFFPISVSLTGCCGSIDVIIAIFNPKYQTCKIIFEAAPVILWAAQEADERPYNPSHCQIIWAEHQHWLRFPKKFSSDSRWDRIRVKSSWNSCGLSPAFVSVYYLKCKCTEHKVALGTSNMPGDVWFMITQHCTANDTDYDTSVFCIFSSMMRTQKKSFIRWQSQTVLKLVG